jgi:thiamine-phosphate pyrophosphorylase
MMPEDCILCYITDRAAFPGDESERRRRLLEKITEAARCDVDYIQLREKDLPTRELESLAGEAVQIVCRNSKQGRSPKSRIIINSRTDVALAVEADGVHLRSGDVSPSHVRTVWATGAGSGGDKNLSGVPRISVSCHSEEEVARAAAAGADFVVFAPVFEKKGMLSSVAGLGALRAACRSKIPILALGGVTLENAQSCFDAGAAGIAAIRLFQENDIAAIVDKLRATASSG